MADDDGGRDEEHEGHGQVCQVDQNSMPDKLLVQRYLFQVSDQDWNEGERRGQDEDVHGEKEDIHCGFYLFRDSPSEWKKKIGTLILLNVVSNQCDQIWRNFATYAKFKKVFGHFLSHYLIFGEIVNLLWQIFYYFGQILIVLNGHIF